MSEVEHQQVQVVHVEPQPHEGLPADLSQSLKVEDTVALEISQLGESVSSASDHTQPSQQVSKIEVAQVSEVTAVGSVSEAAEEIATVNASQVQQQSSSFVLEEQKVEVAPAKNEQSSSQENVNLIKVEETASEVPSARPEEINLNIRENSPLSPKQVKRQNNEAVLLSPRSMPKRSLSPNVLKGKLETVSKMLTKEEDRARELEGKVNQLNQKKQDLEKTLHEKNAAHQTHKEKQEQQERLLHEKDALKKTVQAREHEVKQLLEKKAKEEELHNNEVQRLRAQIKHLEEGLHAKKTEEHSQQLEHSNALSAAKAALQAQIAQLASLKETHQAVHAQQTELAQRINALNQQKKGLESNLHSTKNAKEEQAKAQQLAKANLERRIAEVKEKINNKKNELNQAKSVNFDDLKKEHDKTTHEISHTRSLNEQLTQANRKLEEDIAKKAKEGSENKEGEKKKEKRIIDLTKRSEELSKKIHDLKEESVKLDAQKQEKKVIRYEEKVPEELLALQAKNEALRKEIKKVSERYEAEKAEMEKLVPPSVIENMNKKISAVISNNEKVAEISKIIEEVTKENEKLAEETDKLEWGENNYLRDLENERRKQEQKNKSLEEELQIKKKQLQQLTFKLDEYVKEYPDFKPEKKKKPEPQSEVKGKKEVKKNDKSPPAEQPKKKKGAAVEPVAPPKVEEVKVEQPKSGKNKKKKGVAASEVIQIKQAPVEVKPEKAKVEVKSEIKSEVKVEQKVQVKQGENKPKKKKK